jgi:hypothetical protein
MRFIHFGLGSLVLMVSGCSSKQSSNGLNSLCPSSKPTLPPALSNLSVRPPALLKDPSDPALGMGYWDMNSTKADGTPVSRRCTMTFIPHSTKTDAILLFGAKHCSFSPQSAEFANAKSTLKIWANGGYFEVGVDFLDKLEFSNFSAAFSPLLTAAGADAAAKWEGEIGTNGTQQCQGATTAVQPEVRLGHRVACTSGTDLVNLDAKLVIPEKDRRLFDEIMNELSARTQFLNAMDVRDRELLKAFQRADNLQVGLPHRLREMAYLFNANFCAAPAEHKVTMRKAANPLTRGPWCSNQIMRDFLVAQVKQKIPALYDQHMKAIVEQPTSADFSDSSAIVRLHDQIFGCHLFTLNDVQPDQVEFLNQCDVGHFKKLMWQRWMIEHQNRLGEIAKVNQNTMGMNASTYFTLGVNALLSQAAVDANDHSKSFARVFPISSANRIFEISPNAGSSYMIFSFSPVADKMYFTKKDSGSLLSILGNFPFAALSTIDGEPTSGGAAITPLPSVEVDEPVMPTRRPANGC